MFGQKETAAHDCLGDTGDAVTLGGMDAIEALYLFDQGWLGVPDGHGRQTELQHGQVFQGIAGRKRPGAVDLEIGQ